MHRGSFSNQPLRVILKLSQINEGRMQVFLLKNISLIAGIITKDSKTPAGVQLLTDGIMCDTVTLKRCQLW